MWAARDGTFTALVGALCAPRMLTLPSPVFAVRQPTIPGTNWLKHVQHADCVLCRLDTKR